MLIEEEKPRCEPEEPLQFGEFLESNNIMNMEARVLSNASCFVNVLTQ